MLVGKLITRNSVRAAWERAIHTIDKVEFRVAFNRWLEQQLKCIHVGGVYKEKCYLILFFGRNKYLKNIYFDISIRIHHVYT